MKNVSPIRHVLAKGAGLLLLAFVATACANAGAPPALCDMILSLAKQRVDGGQVAKIKQMTDKALGINPLRNVVVHAFWRAPCLLLATSGSPG